MNHIRLFNPFISVTTNKALQSVFDTGWIGEGPKVKEFEQTVSTIIGNKSLVALNSCTSALELSIDLANLKPGDEVISTPMTCAATNIPFKRRGISLKWADIDPFTGNIDFSCLQHCLSDKTKAIIVMHWGGYPCDLKEIGSFAEKNGLVVIEDAAHAFGSIYKGKLIGNHSDFVCFSFQAIKTITSGDGGILTTRNKDLNKTAKLLRWYGIDREKRDLENFWDYDIKIAGYKYNMNDVTATIGLEGLKSLNEILKIRRDNASYYDELLSNFDHIKLLKYKSDRKSSYYLYTILVEKRDDCIRYLKEHKIGCSIVHKRNDHYSIFDDCVSGVPLNGVDFFYNHLLCIPIGQWLKDGDREYITDILKKGW